ncbi:MAG: hypothetical protein ABIG44_00770 [Planctomycetota bacterium]
MTRSAIALAQMVAITLVFFVGAEQKYKNYELVVDGKTYELNLNEKIEIKTKGGAKLKVELRKKPFAEFSDDRVSFQHKSEMSVSTQNLGDGLTQIMSASALGTLVMIQEYDNMDPTPIVPLLLREITKEQVEYGYKLSQENITRTLASGVKLTGVKATLRYQSEEAYVEILTFGKKDKGIVVVTQIDREFLGADKSVHDLFWKTFKVKD